MKEAIPKQEIHEPGTIENPIIDSHMTLEEALRPNPNFNLAPEIFERQILLEVLYISFDKKYHKGQIVIDRELIQDIKDLFALLIKENFPLYKVVPIADKKFNFDDGLSMVDNNSSGFNPRNIGGTNRPSNHAFGRAIDLNPLQNPFIKNGVTEPAGAVYDPLQPGTLSAEHPIVTFLKNNGWKWGGDYNDLKDYHHFDKALEK